MHKPICPVCRERPSKILKGSFRADGIDQTYVHAAKEPVFCGQRCAVAFALRVAGCGAEDSLSWCATHGLWHDQINGCYQCPGYSGIDDGYDKTEAAAPQ